MPNTARNIRLTAAEISSLWIQYQNDSLATCTIGYFVEKTEDTQIKLVLQTALNLAKAHTQAISNIFTREGFPAPVGFTDDDVVLAAPRLYSDPFHLNYIKNLSKTAMIAYGLSLSLAARSDVRAFIMESLKTAADLDEQATKVMLSKGLYVRPPYVTPSIQPEFIHSSKFLGTFFGDKQRRLSSTEITHLFLNAQSNAIAKALVTGFSQVAQSQELRQLFARAAHIAGKHIEIFNATLKESDIPGPMKLDTNITASTVPPFSDKLMLFHVLALVNMELGYYAAAIGISLRLDISVDYVRLAAEIEKFGYDSIRIAMNNGWVEEPPMTVDRKDLVLSPS